MRKASTEERETLKQQLLELATGASGPAVREAIENCRKGELLEVQWELDDVLEATAPKKAAPPKPPEAPKPEAPPDPNRPLSAKDLTLVYDDPRGLMIHKSKVGNRWFLTQVDPRIIDGVGHAMRTQSNGIGGAFAWPAMLRKLDRIDSSFRS